MSTIIAESYILELKAWLTLISFYKNQTDSFKHKLFQAIRVPMLIKDSARLEAYQVHLMAFQDFLFEMEDAILCHIKQIDIKYIFDDMQKNESIEHQQILLRYKMYTAEKKYFSFRNALSQYLISIFELVILSKLNNGLPGLHPVGRRSANITV